MSGLCREQRGPIRVVTVVHCNDVDVIVFNRSMIIRHLDRVVAVLGDDFRGVGYVHDDIMLSATAREPLQNPLCMLRVTVAGRTTNVAALRGGDSP